MSLISVNGEICGAIPPSLSSSANCKDPLQYFKPLLRILKIHYTFLLLNTDRNSYNVSPPNIAAINTPSFLRLFNMR